MSVGAVYETSRIKRNRATKAEMAERQGAVRAIIADYDVMTVRQCFYQCTVNGVIEKTEAGYEKIQRMLVDMRRSGLIPYSAIADNTRWMRKPNTYVGIEHALVLMQKSYRKSLWADADIYCEVWLEKDALAGVVMEVTDQYDVPLMVSRGYASLSFLHSAAEYISAIRKPAFIYHAGDHDPSGVDAARKIEATLRELAPYADIHFERLAVLPWQIEHWELPTRPTKSTDTRAKKWTGGESVELDAIRPDLLCALIRSAIERHLPPFEFSRLLRIEAEEKDSIGRFIKSWRAA